MPMRKMSHFDVDLLNKKKERERQEKTGCLIVFNFPHVRMCQQE